MLATALNCKNLEDNPSGKKRCPVACVARFSVGLSAGLKHFSLFERAKIGASSKKCQKAKNASNGRKNLQKRLLRRLVILRHSRKPGSVSSFYNPRLIYITRAR